MAGKDEKKSLDIFSAEFDANEAIFNPAFVIPDPEAPASNNVDAFVAKYEGKKTESKKKPEAELPPTVPPSAQPSVSRFQGILKANNPDESAAAEPKQGPRRQKSPKNVLTYMQKTGAKGGPMSLLAKCVEEEKRVKVMVRGVEGIRGHVTGFLVAFDKHWNMALTDAEETFRRRKKVKSPPVAQAQVVSDLKDLRLGKSKSRKKSPQSSSRDVVGFSTVHVIERKRKSEVCKRHIPQVLLRGEHVACIVPISSS